VGGRIFRLDNFLKLKMAYRQIFLDISPKGFECTSYYPANVSTDAWYQHPHLQVNMAVIIHTQGAIDLLQGQKQVLISVNHII
jgi:hypothetical protein